MSDQQHPITPPDELVWKWHREWCQLKVKDVGINEYVAAQGARWGADQELKACCEWMQKEGAPTLAAELRGSRRPEPPSLAAKALDAAEDMSDCMNDGFVPNRSSLDIIRHALERLQELEKGNE